ncbi:triphosphoribosyl-dephospho-CoA synthase MdcB [Methylobacterium radiodurans]|uniref:Probable 2-(5''-triphosphoribosyl)-3'-dephosphocoenzyme-A synthase n=1 Tax=Methylobacterium radiodurans TaxID=2202828 RepID=A0A2U8VQM0_9HYPH|nr:triphosphoribosyl-dephospho-CoA synthase MdcB [Methylobacterium radiodurans]AWN35925.1 triphosphoribosyl-dephospho-CoA synthase MdcB [Methylobacterium radiodurans]
MQDGALAWAAAPLLRDLVPAPPSVQGTLPHRGRGEAAAPAASLAARAVAALRLELDTYPKPGLVSRIDSGSHVDMDAATFAASAAALEPHFAALARAGAAGRDMAALRRIGLDAEAAMRAATGGVNTHRGAIFGLGLLVSAAGALGAGARPPAPGALGAHVRTRHAAGILDGPELLHAPGARARRRHAVGGAPAEAAAGFPTLYRIGLPALRRARRLRPGDANAARVGCCLALVAALEDTNLLHRGGAEGYRFAREAAARFDAAGGVAQDEWYARAQALHRAFVARRLSPGGAADLLAMTLFVDAVEAHP